MSSKGPWRLARTYATQCGMTNAWLKEQGLVSVRDLWIAFHYPNGQLEPLMNRPVRTRTPGGVVSGGEKPPLTRLANTSTELIL